MTTLTLFVAHTIRLRSAPLLALALASAACTLEITDFNESASDATSDTTTEGSSDNSSSAGGDSTGDDSTGDDSTGSTTGEAFPACAAYTDDPKNVDGEACAEELGCGSFDSEETCVGGYYYNEANFNAVGCVWGDVFTGTYDSMAEMCNGEVTGVCVAASFLGDGGPPCSGYHRAIEGGVEVVNLECSTPIAGGFEGCYVDVDDPEIPACSCLPPWP